MSFRKIFLCLVFCAVNVPLIAKTEVKLPLQPVCADSVDLQDFFWSLQERKILKKHPQMERQTLLMEKRDYRAALKQRESWEEKMKNLHLLGYEKDAAQPVTSAINVAEEGVRLALATGESRYVDVAARALYNTISAEGTREVSSEEHEAAEQTIINFPGMMFATSGEHVYINFPARSEAHIKNKELDFRVETLASVPWYNDLLFLFRLDKEHSRMALHVRVPNWLSTEVLEGYEYSKGNGTYSVWVNGDLKKPEIRDGYLVIEREWADSDYVRVQYPSPIKRVVSTDDATQMALQKGDLVFVNTNLPEGMTVSASDLIHSEFDKKKHTQTLTGNYYNAQGERAGRYEAFPYATHGLRPEARLFVPLRSEE